MNTLIGWEHPQPCAQRIEQAGDLQRQREVLARVEGQPYYTLVAQEDDGSVVRINHTQGHTEAEQEALQEQAARHRGNAWVQTEWRTAQWPTTE